MSELKEQLLKAQKRRKLINVYQVNNEVVYTGYVKRVGSQAFILETYNDNGIRDGGVLLKNVIVDFIETDSFDLDHMKKLILFADKQKLHHEETELLLPSAMELTQALLTLLQNQQMLAMLITTRAGKDEQYQESVVVKFDDQQILVDRIDKYDFQKRRTVVLRADEVVGIEFGGQEMASLTPLLSQMVPANHVDPQQLVLTDLPGQLQELVSSQQLAIVQPKNNREYFYIGQFLVANVSEMIMAMVDGNGQFGGYVWFRYDDIQQVITTSDYLSVIAAVVAENKSWHRFAAPLLNADRAFDANDNNFLRIIGQSQRTQAVIRFRSLEAGTITGVIKRINKQNATLTVSTVDDDIVQEKNIGLETIVEMAFEYLKTYLARL